MDRTEEVIAAELETARREYHEGCDALTVAEARKAADRIKALAAELSALLSAGAEPCSQCGNRPVGARNNEFQYRVICPACPSEVVEHRGTSEVVRHRRSVGNTPARAVQRWNAGEFDVVTRRA